MTVALDKKRFGPWALVTGASSGIGKEFARQIAASGINVVLVARRAELLKEVGVELSKRYGVEHRVVVLDVSREDFIGRLSEGLDPRFLKIIPPGSAAFDSCQCAVALLKLSRRFADVWGGTDVPVVHRPKPATARGLQAMGAPSAGPSAARAPVGARGHPRVFRSCPVRPSPLSTSRRCREHIGGNLGGIPSKGYPSIAAHIASNAATFPPLREKPGELGVTLAPASRRQSECVWAVVAHAA
jgi:hypothetical protein